MKHILSVIFKHRAKKSNKVDRLYYLTGIKPIQANKYALNECTVGRE